MRVTVTFGMQSPSLYRLWRCPLPFRLRTLSSKARYVHFGQPPSYHCFHLRSLYGSPYFRPPLTVADVVGVRVVVVAHYNLRHRVPAAAGSFDGRKWMLGLLEVQRNVGGLRGEEGQIGFPLTHKSYLRKLVVEFGLC